tara:strand:+ start:1609 stop:2013 length:405 start_codon:yes stop_codon:yes gene_type:complete
MHQLPLREVAELSTQTIGTSGEHYVISDLLRQGIECYRPCSDEVNTDLVCFINGSFRRIQIKTVGVYKTRTSVEVRMRDNKINNHIDYVAVYLFHEGIIAYYPYNGEKSITLALRRAKNNQHERTWFYEFEEIA